MTLPRPVVIDFETLPIEPRPDYPPAPVGVSIKEPGKKPVYYSWAHKTGSNTCSKAAAVRALKAVWRHPGGLLFHNGKFDIDVAETHLGMPRLPWDHYHDTLFLTYLDSPHATSFALKPTAERILGLPPAERDEVFDWLVCNQPVSETRITLKGAGAWIAWCPPDIVGPYANGDCERTGKLFATLYPRIVEAGMLTAYDRERRLMPHLLDNERQGVPVDLERLGRELTLYRQMQEKCAGWVRKRLATPDLNLDSGEGLAHAMIAAGAADPLLLGTTKKTGKLQTNKEALGRGVTDKTLAAILQYHSQLSTCLGTFMEPWHRTADKTGGLIHTNWNQVRQNGQRGMAGARTGRLSSSPNFQNIPNEFKEIFAGLRASFLKGLPPLPLVRRYITPFKGETLIDRDFSQQELRILAHFEDGVLKRAYDADKWLDVHDYMRAMVNRMLGRNYDRKAIKNTNFGIIYGMGLPALSTRNGTGIEEARDIKNAVFAVCPGLKAMYADMRMRAKNGQPIRTWGGRVYRCEEPKIIDGRMIEFDYKLVNYLIQGSAADCTKEAVIRYCDAKPKDHRMLLQVHDQIDASVPAGDEDLGMKIMREAMESVEFDVPMLSEGKIGLRNWAEMSPYDVRGETVWRGVKP